MIIDRLYEDVKAKGNVCVGLDTDPDYIPGSFMTKYTFVEDAIFRFNQKIIDATFQDAACYKLQIAFYEAMGLMGMRVYKKTLNYVRSIGGIAIADIKRGDIASTAKMYAKAHYEGDFESDIVTLSPYMGMDSIEPYLPYVKEKEKGMFLLLRTSNKGAEDIQYIKTSDDSRVYHKVAEKIEEEATKYLGECGYSSIGAVVGCTHTEEAAFIRNKMKKIFLLIPGYGAQGGTAEDVAKYLVNGNGGIVNSSRGILLAYKKHEDGAKIFDIYAGMEAKRMKEEIRHAAKF